MKRRNLSRRSFLGRAGGFLGTAAFLGPDCLLAGEKPRKEGVNHKKEAEVSPAEDLMREHGVLDRILLIYNEILTRWKHNRAFPPEALTNSAAIIHRFIENYHEKLEEEYLFPRFEKAGKLTDLVRVLREQHQAGRQLTESILSQDRSTLEWAEERKNTAKNLLLFTKMYRPHKAREDTVLFPSFHSLVSAEEFDQLGDEFEAREQSLFGESGFEKIVAEVAKIERTLGIYDLAQFTLKG